MSEAKGTTCKNCGLDSYQVREPVQVPIYVEPQRSDVSRGVDLGCGAFIMLPLIITGIVIGVIAVALLFAGFLQLLGF